MASRRLVTLCVAPGAITASFAVLAALCSRLIKVLGCGLPSTWASPYLRCHMRHGWQAPWELQYDPVWHYNLTLIISSPCRILCPMSILLGMARYRAPCTPLMWPYSSYKTDYSSDGSGPCEKEIHSALVGILRCSGSQLTGKGNVHLL